MGSLMLLSSVGSQASWESRLAQKMNLADKLSGAVLALRQPEWGKGLRQKVEVLRQKTADEQTQGQTIKLTWLPTSRFPPLTNPLVVP
jgi:hypothetical protein